MAHFSADLRCIPPGHPGAAGAGSPPSVEGAARPIGERRAAPARGRVLLVEDDEATREVLVEVLREEAYEVAEAADGRQALVLLRQWRPDLIVLDLVMPGMDGWFFRAQQQRIERVRDIPVIVTSARRPPWREEDLLEPAAYLPKPFDLKDFLAMVRALVDPRLEGPAPVTPPASVRGQDQRSRPKGP